MRTSNLVPYKSNIQELDDFIYFNAEINPYKPSTLAWNAVKGATCYKIKSDSDFENPDKRYWQSGDYWETTETTYVRTLPAGEYDLYVEAYADTDNTSEPIKTSEKIHVNIKDEVIYFEDETFREYLKGYVLNNDLWHYKSKLESEDVFTFNDLPRELAIKYTIDKYNDSAMSADMNCSFYILNSDGSKNYDIEKLESINDYDYAVRGGTVGVQNFTNLKEISSVKFIHLSDEAISGDLSKFLGYFPNLEEAYVGGTLDKCDVLEKLKKIRTLGISIKGTESDFTHISRMTSLENLSISIDNTGEIDFSPMKNITNLKSLNIGIKDNNKEIDFSPIMSIITLTDLSIGSANIKDTKISNSKINTLSLANVTLNGNKISNGLNNLVELNITDSYITDGTFINKLSKLEELNLDGVRFGEAFVLSNENIKTMGYTYGNNNNDSLDLVIFGDVSSVENLSIYSTAWWYGPLSTFNHTEELNKFINLKTLQISNFKSISDLDFLGNLTKLEGIYLSEVYGPTSFPKMDNHDKLMEIHWNHGTVKDISNLEKLVNKDTFKRLHLTNQDYLNPNSPENQKIFDTLEKRRRTDESVDFSATNYLIKDFISDAINVTSIFNPALGYIEAFTVNHSTTIQDLITVERFPIAETYDVKVVSSNGEEKNDDEKVGSKDKVQIINTLGEILQEYTVIVPGDVTGNGLVKLYDTFKILNDSVKKVEIDELDVKIRDYNEDEKVTTYDALQYMKETMKEE